MAKKPQRRPVPAARKSGLSTRAAGPMRFESAGAALVLVMATLVSAAGVEAALLAAAPRSDPSLQRLAMNPLVPFLPAPVVLLAGAVLVGVARARGALHLGLWLFAAMQVGLLGYAAYRGPELSPGAAGVGLAFVAVNVIGIVVVRSPGFVSFVADQDRRRRQRYPVGYGVGVTGGVSAVIAAPLVAAALLLDLQRFGAPALFEGARARGHSVNPLVLVGVPLALGALFWANRSRLPVRIYLAAMVLCSAAGLPFAASAGASGVVATLLALGVSGAGVWASFRPGFDEFWTTPVE